ncbi:MAG: zinc-ribbon domain-containing protein [Clostridia bacterium]|nr:zinc-ribbon domain-containing protein [Clostridia bacterium]
MFVCKICGKEVKSGQAFCPTCGADVVENYETVCPACGSKNSAGSRYCAKCGGILNVLRKPVCAVCGAKNLPGAKFCVSCGAPIIAHSETHSEADMLDARRAKHKLDSMARERMAAVDKEIAEKRAKTQEEREQAMLEVEDYKKKTQSELDKKANMLEAYREKLNELGSEDVSILKKMSAALKDYSVYYADPYSQIDEDDIEGETYVCPACGTINPITATSCSHCGRNKARATLLLAKGKIKQSPPIKRKLEIIKAPEEDLTVEKTPTLQEFEERSDYRADQNGAPRRAEQKKDAPENFSGPSQGYPLYPYPPYGYPYGYPAQGAPAGFYGGQSGDGYQMPPIVQPVAFVPYVTQEQPLMQYSPTIEEEKKPQPVQPQPTGMQPIQPTPTQPQKRSNR